MIRPVDATKYWPPIQIGTDYPESYLLTSGGDPVNLTGCAVYSQIYRSKDPGSPLVATFTMTLAEDPATGGFSGLLAVAAQSGIDYRLAPFWRDILIQFPGPGSPVKYAYGTIGAYPTVTQKTP